MLLQFSSHTYAANPKPISKTILSLLPLVYPTQQAAYQLKSMPLLTNRQQS